MNGFQEQIYQRLSDDTTLVSLCPGGIYLYDDWPDEKGLNQDTMPAAYQSGKLKIVLQVRGRDALPRPGAPDDPEEQVKFMSQVVEIYAQADQTTPFVNMHPVTERVFTLLHERAFDNLSRLEWDRSFHPYRDPGLDNAATLRMDFLVEGMIGG